MRLYKEIKKYWEDVHHQKHLGALSGCQFIEIEQENPVLQLRDELPEVLVH